jgi:hypothetical protein
LANANSDTFGDSLRREVGILQSRVDGAVNVPDKARFIGRKLRWPIDRVPEGERNQVDCLRRDGFLACPIECTAQLFQLGCKE